MNPKTAANYPGDSTLTTHAEYFYYDIGGNLSLYRNPAGQYKHLNFADSYDSRNRLRHSAWTASRYSMVVDWNIGQEIFTNYDPASRITSIVTNNGATNVAFGYDAANRKVWEDQSLAGYPTRRVDTPRDADGNRHALQVSTLYYIEYAYTPRNQLASIGSFANFTYDASGNMTSRLQSWLYNNGTNFAYDDLSRVSQIELGDNSHIFSTRHFQYDTVNREKLTWRDEDNGFGTGRGERFEYDPSNQLKKVYYEAQNVWATNPANAVNTQEYSYTADRLNRASVSNNGVVTSYVMPNGMNQYTTVGGQGVSYDARFNIAGYNGMTFAYDAQNRLVGGSMQATYDGLGRCVKRTVNGQTRLFTYDDWNPILEWDQSGNRLAWNVYGARPDEILARDDTTHGSLIYKQDHHGNVVALLSWSGVVEKYTYDAFGKATVTDAAGSLRGGSWYGNRFMFTGREWIAELGIYDYRNRMYHPALGRFLQVDPLGFGAGDMNIYRYCGDDSVDRSDPMGLLAGFTKYQLVYDPNEKIDDTHDGYHVAGLPGFENTGRERVQLEVDRSVGAEKRIDGSDKGGVTHVESTTSNKDNVPTIHQQINVRYASGAGPKTREFTRNNEWTHSKDAINAANSLRGEWANRLGLRNWSTNSMVDAIRNGNRSLGMTSLRKNDQMFVNDQKEKWDNYGTLHDNSWIAPNGHPVAPHSPIDRETGNPLSWDE
jgi:RHS repeat-associated protein